MPSSSNRIEKEERVSDIASHRPNDESSVASIPVPQGVASLELGISLVRHLVERHGAEVLEYDLTAEEGSIALRIQLPLPA